MAVYTEQMYKPEELVELVTWLAEKKYGWDSTSISYEAAESLMEAVLYCIETYDCAASVLVKKQGTSAKQAYQTGYRIVIDRVMQVKALYTKLLPHFQSYGLSCLQDTVLKGIPAFLRHYDARFCPQNTLLTLDYPILQNISSNSGVNAILPYMQAIEMEQRFLSRFSVEYVEEVLFAYHNQYHILIENICSILLGNLFGHLLLQKPLSQKGFCTQEYQQICTKVKQITKMELEQNLHQILVCFIQEQYEGDIALLQYLDGECSNLAARIEVGAETGRLEKIFLL